MVADIYIYGHIDYILYIISHIRKYDNADIWI